MTKLSTNNAETLNLSNCYLNIPLNEHFSDELIILMERTIYEFINWIAYEIKTIKKKKIKWIEKRASKWLDIITFPIDRYFDDKQIIRSSYQ